MWHIIGIQQLLFLLFSIIQNDSKLAKDKRINLYNLGKSVQCKQNFQAILGIQILKYLSFLFSRADIKYYPMKTIYIEISIFKKTKN